MLTPKLFTTLKGYTTKQFFSDAVAGIVVGIVAIPLAIAFAIASGVSPDRGLITVVVAGFLISALGGSKVQIGGPTGAFVVIIYAVVQKHGVDGLVVATLMAGILLVVMGLARFGTIIKFIPHSVIVGFTSGIAVIIFKSQFKDFCGYTGAGFNIYAAALGLLSVLIILFWPKISRRMPGALIALLLTSVIAVLFKLPVETIGSRFGHLPSVIPMPVIPKVSLTLIRDLFPSAFAIALLGSVESLLSAVVSDGMIGAKHRSNMELVGQGVANIGAALFGGIPATGAIARTVTNIKNGGRTPVAGLIHALVVLLIVIFLGKFIVYVPLACLAGILVVVAYNMSEWRSFLELLKSTKGVILVLLATFLLTVFVDLAAAIQVGMVLYAFIFMKRMSDTSSVHLLAKELRKDEKAESQEQPGFSIPKGVEVFEIDGPLFFNATEQFDEIDKAVGEKPKARILRFRNVPFIDSTGMHALKGFIHRCSRNKIPLIIEGLRIQPLNEIIKADLYEVLGEDNVCGSIQDAILRAEEMIGKQ